MAPETGGSIPSLVLLWEQCRVISLWMSFIFFSASRKKKRKILRTKNRIDNYCFVCIWNTNDDLMLNGWNDLNAEPETFQTLLAQQIVCVGISSMKITKIRLNNKWILKRVESNEHRIMIFPIFFSPRFCFYMFFCRPNDGYF